MTPRRGLPPELEVGVGGRFDLRDDFPASLALRASLFRCNAFDVGLGAHSVERGRACVGAPPSATAASTSARGAPSVALARRRTQMAALGLPAMQTPQEARPDFVELCGYYERLYPENARFWQCGAAWAEAQARGPAALMELIEGWGFTRGDDGKLQAPPWWSERCVVPMEFMDCFPGRYDDATLRAADIEPARFHAPAVVHQLLMCPTQMLISGCAV